MNTEDLQALIWPAVVLASAAVAVLAMRRDMRAAAYATLAMGWLGASVNLTLMARESYRWPVVGYLQNLVVFLAMTAGPFLVAYGTGAWLQSRGVPATAHVALTVVLALLVLPVAALSGPFWILLLKSTFGWQYIGFP